MPLQQIDTLTPSQLSDLHALYQREWWSQGRTAEEVRAVVENSSLILGFADESGRLAAFCRLLTDFTFHATLYDVIVAEDRRGQGLGKRLMQAVIEHPRLRQVRGVWLCCRPEMVPFYEKWGFEASDAEILWMVRPGLLSEE